MRKPGDRKGVGKERSFFSEIFTDQSRFLPSPRLDFTTPAATSSWRHLASSLPEWCYFLLIQDLDLLCPLLQSWCSRSLLLVEPTPGNKNLPLDNISLN